MKTFVVSGPESTGKTWLSKLLAEHFDSVWRPEYLRTFYEQNNGVTQEQMQIVAERQMEQEMNLFESHQSPIFLDTNIINLKVYYQYYFKKEPHWFEKLYNPSLYDHYILLDTSVPWVEDEQRESPEVRDNVFGLLVEEYKRLNISYDIVFGDYHDRKKQILQLVASRIST